MSYIEVKIVIPVYNQVLNNVEKTSLFRALKIFNRRPIEFIAPDGLDVRSLTDLIEYKHNNFSFSFFPPEFFKSIEGYNRLLLTSNFYNQFINAEFILIYQLDAYIFRDELKKWCGMGYDYIGAPWIISNGNTIKIEEFAGNGGFSLRRVSSCLETLMINKMIVLNPFQLINQYKNYGIIRVVEKLPLIAARSLGFRNNTRYYIDSNTKKEDIFWAYFASSINKNFKSIKGIDAVAFSFDRYPSYLYKLNNYKLPCGCHSWFKNEPLFWAQFINTSSSQI